MNRLRTYRLAPALLVLALVLTGAGPLLQHLCAQTAEHVAMHESAHACCQEGCLVHTEAPSGDTPADADATCCMAAPAAPVEEVAAATSPAPRSSGVLFAVALPVWAIVANTSVVPGSPAPSDDGPPPLPVRTHLAHSVLLI